MSPRAVTGVLLAAIAVLAGQVFARPFSLREGFSRDAAVAVTLYETGVYTDGLVAPGAAVSPGRYSAPAYAGMIAGLGVLDSDWAGQARCALAKKADCAGPFAFRFVIYAQFVLAAVALWLSYWLAATLSGSRETGLVTMAIVLLGGKFGEYARLLYPHVPIAVTQLIVAALMYAAWRQQSLWLALLTGAAAGVLALLDSIYVPLLWVLAAALFVAGVRIGSIGRCSAGAVALLIGAYAVLGPWHLRNQSYFGDIAIAPQHEAIDFAERAAYASMTPHDLAAALVVWLPVIGNGYGAAIFGQDTVDRLGAYKPGSYRMTGETIARQTREPGVIAQRYIASNPIGYLASLIPILYRGLWSTGSVFVLWGAFLLPRFIRRLGATHTLAPFLVLATPLVVITVIQALLSANHPWANMSLLFVYAYAIAYVFAGLEVPLAWRRKI